MAYAQKITRKWTCKKQNCERIGTYYQVSRWVRAVDGNRGRLKHVGCFKTLRAANDAVRAIHIEEAREQAQKGVDNVE